jgi:mono/diheme cytochrome c family protein
MRMNRAPFLVVLLAAFALGLSCQKKPDAKPVDFVTQIKPILQGRCINCHNSNAIFGDLNLENRAMATKTRAKGPILTPGKPEQSQLYIVLTLPEPETKSMPPTGHRIPDADVELVKHWVEQGAKWPDGADGVLKPQAVN